VPKAVVPTLGEMDEELHRDLWRAARRVHAMITEEYGATGANIAVQDGIAAGQSVPHAHVHVLPRR
jgi:bis(5'-adenosyl)-triphosphatase